MTDKELDDLEARLRDRRVCSIAHNSCRNDTTCESAADAIVELRGKNAGLGNQLLRTQSALVEVADKAPDGMMISGNAWCELSCSRKALEDKENTQ